MPHENGTSRTEEIRAVFCDLHLEGAETRQHLEQLIALDELSDSTEKSISSVQTRSDTIRGH